MLQGSGVVLAQDIGPAAEYETVVAADTDQSPNFPLRRGPASPEVRIQESEANEQAAGFLRRETMLGPWFDYKRKLRDEKGIGFGGGATLLYQNYSDSLVDENDALGSKIDLNGVYELFRRGTDEVGTFNISLESRNRVLTDLSPAEAGAASGALNPTAVTYSNDELGIKQFFWQQNLFDNRFQYAAGRLFSPNYVDPYPLTNDNRYIVSYDLGINPTIPYPKSGLGAVGLVYLDDSAYVGGGLLNANGSYSGNDFSSFIQDNEYFYFMELGATKNARKPVPFSTDRITNLDKISLTLWYKDDQKSRQIDDSWGAGFTAHALLTERYFGFVRAGWSDGDATTTDAYVSSGVLIRPPTTVSDVLGLTASYLHPSKSVRRNFEDSDNQLTTEIFYRFHITPHLALTPHVQYIVEPVRNPDDSSLVVLGARVRLTF